QSGQACFVFLSPQGLLAFNDTFKGKNPNIQSGKLDAFTLCVLFVEASKPIDMGDKIVYSEVLRPEHGRVLAGRSRWDVEPARITDRFKKAMVAKILNPKVYILCDEVRALKHRSRDSDDEEAHLMTEQTLKE